MKVISVVNYKGGVGKTTLTANIAAELAYRGNAVLVVDLDPQCSLTFSLIEPEFWGENLQDWTLKRYFDAIFLGDEVHFSDIILRPERVNQRISEGDLELVPSHLQLIDVDMELASLLFGIVQRQQRLNYLKVYNRLLDGLKEIEYIGYDYVFFDCPPNFNIVTKNSVIASDYILIPTKADYLSTLGIQYLQSSLEFCTLEYNEYAEKEGLVLKDPKILGIVFTMVQFYGGDPIKTQATYINRIIQQSGLITFSDYLRENKSLFSMYQEAGIPVALQGDLKPTFQQIVNEIENIVDEFEDLINTF